MKRISYNIIYDSIYTFLCTILISPIFASVIRFLFSPSIPYFPYIVVIPIVLLIPAIILSIRPVLGLFNFPDTIYLSKNEKLFFYDKKTELKISDIKEINVNSIAGAPGLIYYEIFFHTLPSFIDKRKNKRFLLVESYDVRYMFSIKDYLLKTFIKLGLPEEKIINTSYGGKHKFDL